MVITARLGELLVGQLGMELSAHQQYNGIAIYFERQSLNRWFKLFSDQALEEAQHARKIMTFLVDNGVDFDLPQVTKGPTHFGSALEAAQTALDSERNVSERFRAMATAALEDGDHTSFQFLQWFIDEQVEEERTAQAVVDLIASGVNLFQAEPLLDSVG